MAIHAYISDICPPKKPPKTYPMQLPASMFDTMIDLSQTNSSCVGTVDEYHVSSKSHPLLQSTLIPYGH